MATTAKKPSRSARDALAVALFGYLKEGRQLPGREAKIGRPNRAAARLMC